jgi:hypothetical protein
MLSLEKVSRKGLNPYMRPIANMLSWLAPTAAIVATERNTLYPDIQAGARGGGLGLPCSWSAACMGDGCPKAAAAAQPSSSLLMSSPPLHFCRLSGTPTL